MFNKTRQKELTETGKSELYTDLTKLIIKIADYIFRKEEDIRKGIGDIMGGKVLELNLKDLKLRDVQKEKQSGRFREKLDLEACSHYFRIRELKKSRLYQQTQKDVSSYIKNTIFKKNGKRQISF